MYNESFYHNDRLNEAMRDRTPEPPEYEDCSKCDGTGRAFTKWSCCFCGREIPSGLNVVPLSDNNLLGNITDGFCCGEHEVERDSERCTCDDGAVIVRRGRS
jgi:hypothetical protein